MNQIRFIEVPFFYKNEILQGNIELQEVATINSNVNQTATY